MYVYIYTYHVFAPLLGSNATGSTFGKRGAKEVSARKTQFLYINNGATSFPHQPTSIPTVSAMIPAPHEVKLVTT